MHSNDTEKYIREDGRGSKNNDKCGNTLRYILIISTFISWDTEIPITAFHEEKVLTIVCKYVL